MAEASSRIPRITFGVIVLNGEPFTRYCLRQVYPFAHEIIVVEGASENARTIATADGHSRDATLDVLHEFKTHEDPDDKLTIVTREGFWSEKDAMSQSYGERATGDWLWQVDIDEFYTREAMSRVCSLLVEEPDITAVSFRQRTFWGDFDVECDGVYLRTYRAAQYHRLFRWGKGYRYAAHRPPTVVDADGVDLRAKRWIGARRTEAMGIVMHHYSLLFPHQVKEKCEYYSRFGWDAARESNQWAQDCYLSLRHPFRVHNTYRYPSWLLPYHGNHPEQIERMRQDLANGTLKVERRPMEDAWSLLGSPWYRVAAKALEFYADRVLPVGIWIGRTVRRVGVLRHGRRLMKWIRGCDRAR